MKTLREIANCNMEELTPMEFNIGFICFPYFNIFQKNEVIIWK